VTSRNARTARAQLLLWMVALIAACINPIEPTAPPTRYDTAAAPQQPVRHLPLPY
jgi:hypothetical protein